MKTAALALAATLLAGSAFAQATNPPATTPPPPPAAAPDGPAMRPPPPPPPGGPMRRGAYFKLEAPGGAELTVRCADGEPTRACADIVLDMLDKIRGARQAPDRDGMANRRWDRDDRYRDRNRNDD